MPLGHSVLRAGADGADDAEDAGALAAAETGAAGTPAPVELVAPVDAPPRPNIMYAPSAPPKSASAPIPPQIKGPFDG